MDKINKISIFTAIIIVGFTLAVFYNYIMGTYLGFGWPFNTFLFAPLDRFSDFTYVYNIFTDPYSGFAPQRNYFPFAYFFMYIYKNIQIHWAFLTHIFIYILFFAYISYKNLKSKDKILTFLSIFAFTFISYPNIFVIDRGNIEIYAFMSLFLFAFFYQKERYNLSTVFLIVSILLKLYPILFIFLLFSDKKYKHAFITIATVPILFLIGYSILPGGMLQNIANHLVSLKLYINYTLFKDVSDVPHAICYNHSLFLFIKGLYISIAGKISKQEILSLYSIYNILAIALLGLSGIFVTFFEKKFWKKITIITFFMLLLPISSFDYKLINAFIPIFMFINTQDKSKYDLIYAILFALLLVPKAYLNFFVFFSPSSPVTINGFANVLIMLTIILIIIKERFTKQDVIGAENEL